MTFDGSSSNIAGTTEAPNAAAAPAAAQQRPVDDQAQTPVKDNGQVAGAVNGNGHHTLTESLAKGIRDASEAVTDVMDLVAKVRFEVYEVGGTILVQVVDRESGEVVRQIPSAEFLAVHQKLEEFRSLLLDDVA